MRKSALLLVSMALALVLVSGVAPAATFRGTDGDDDRRGTQESDQIFGRGGNDGHAGAGKDVIVVGPPVAGSGKHRVYCGSGYDTVYYYSQSLRDIVTHDCEKVRRVQF